METTIQPELFNPMLAGEGVVGEISYPKLASPKLNGVRGLIQNNTLYARSLKPIVNNFVQDYFSGRPVLNGLDGELVVGYFGDKAVFTRTTSGVMSQDGEPDVRLYVFDYLTDTTKHLPFKDRNSIAKQLVQRLGDGRTVWVRQKLVHNDEEMQAFAKATLDLGFEGLVLRCPNALYKHGRSTDKEGTFLRFVPWHTSEAVILDVLEGEINGNESVVNELGYLKKSSAKAGKIPSGQAGSFKVQDLKTKAIFHMPVPGDEFQKAVWSTRGWWASKQIIRYKYKDGVKGDIPRYAQYEGLRAVEDMS